MLRLLLFVLYLAALSASDQAKSGGWDPNGLTAPAPEDGRGGADPNGLTGNLDPDG